MGEDEVFLLLILFLTGVGLYQAVVMSNQSDTINRLTHTIAYLVKKDRKDD